MVFDGELQQTWARNLRVRCHNEVEPTEAFMRVLVVAVRLSNVAGEPVHREIHLGELHGLARFLCAEHREDVPEACPLQLCRYLAPAFLMASASLSGVPTTNLSLITGRGN
jgi:hypothetical protein